MRLSAVPGQSAPPPVPLSATPLGAFDVTVAPGEDVQVAVDRCPRGGSVLLLPGTHAGPLVLASDKDVHVSGGRQATLQTADGDVLTSSSENATVEGIFVRREAGGGGDGVGVRIKGGRLRLLACDVIGAQHHCVKIEGGADPLVIDCKCVVKGARRDASFAASLSVYRGILIM